MTGPTRLTALQIYTAARQAGFTPDQAQTMTAIALAESGGDPTAHASVGENSWGIFQINVAAHPQLAGVDLENPAVNAHYAYLISDAGQDISPWSTTHRDRGGPPPYLQYRAQAQAAAVAYGDPGVGGNWSGVAGYGDHEPAAGGEVGASSSATPAPGAGGDPEPDPGAGPAPDPGADVTQPSDLHGIDAQVDAELRQGLNPYLVDSGHRGVADGVLSASSGSSSGDALLQGFHAEYLAEHTAGRVATDLPTATGTTAQPSESANQSTLDAFMHAAEGEIGASYVFGAKADGDVAHPQALDCSGLTAWAAARAGIHLPAGAAHQYLYLKGLGTAIPVQEAEHIPGALMFTFDGEPQPGGEPEVAHVVISDGHGGTIEAMDPADGVLRSQAGNRFDFAALIPGISAPLQPTGTSDPTADPASTATPDGHDGSNELDTFLAAIRQHESGGNYQANSPSGGAHGAYQFIDSTWATWVTQAGYPQYAGEHASDAPPAVQDAAAKAMAVSAYGATHNWGSVACIWYIGHQPQGAEWDTVPMPQYGNTITPRQYADDVLSRMKTLGASTAPIEPTTTDPTSAPAGSQLSPAEVVAAEIKEGADPFVSDQGHTGISDGTRLLSLPPGHGSPNSDPSDSDLARGFELGYADQHTPLDGGHGH